MERKNGKYSILHKIEDTENRRGAELKASKPVSAGKGLTQNRENVGGRG